MPNISVSLVLQCPMRNDATGSMREISSPFRQRLRAVNWSILGAVMLEQAFAPHDPFETQRHLTP